MKYFFFVKENNQPLKDDRFSSKQKLSCICRHICTCVYMYMNISVDVGYVWVGFHDVDMCINIGGWVGG